MFLLLACAATTTVGGGATADRGGVTPENGDSVEVVEGGSDGYAACPAPESLYQQDCVVQYDLDIAAADWEAMQTTYDSAVANCGISQDVLHETHVATLQYGAQALEVGIRLKGNACTFLRNGKMQFRIDVNYVVPDQRLNGVEHINLEAANYDPTVVKNGLALSIFRDAGLVAPLANHAALTVNGAYYGFYENIEQIDQQFLSDRYADASGNLYWFIWNGAYGELKTNKAVADVSNWSAMQTLIDATPSVVTMADFEAQIVGMVDVDELLLAFAVEAVVPQTDGVWAGSANCYVYDNPLGCAGAGCFEYLPWDLDSAFLAPPQDLCPACGAPPDTVTADPITFITGRGPARKWRLWDLVIAVPRWRAQYIANLQTVLNTAYDPDVLAARHGDILARIQRYADVDSHLDHDRFTSSNEELSVFFARRSAFVQAWVDANE